MAEIPAVCVVVPTRDRPALLARAVRSMLDQQYGGQLEVRVVVDQADATAATAGLPDDPRIVVMTNQRKPGLSGARNSGILAASAALVAFCDDDDEWLAGRLARQVSALQATPAAEFATCGIEIDYEGKRSVRLAGASQISHTDLLPSRMVMLHSSTFLIRRDALLNGIGMLSEEIPGSQNEDWDLLLRAARRHALVHVDEPLVRVYWSPRSYFDSDWDTKVSSLLWMLDQHPEIDRNTVGAARVYGQIAFAKAASGQRRQALRWAWRSVRRRWHEPRGYLAVATAGGLSADALLRLAHRRGHGI